VTARPFVIGVTGNIACGKSLVLRTLADLGAATIDADTVYHGLIAPGEPLWGVLRDRFGPGIIAPDQSIDRRALGRLVFSEPNLLAELDALTHPAVVLAIQRQIAESLAQVVAVDAVKLIESGLDRSCDAVWVVICRPEQSVERLMRRNDLSRDDASARVVAQPSGEANLVRSGLVIENSGTRDQTRTQVIRGWRNALRLDTTEKIV